MGSDRTLRSEFRDALDDVLPPAPWLAASVADDLRRRRSGRSMDRGFGTSRKRAAVAAALVMVLLAAAIAAAFIAARLHQPILIKTPPPAAGSATVPISTAHFFDAQEAGVVTEQGLLLTKDGGKHWQLVLKLDWKNANLFSFVGPNQIVVVTQSQGEDDPIYTTSDGGVHWQTSRTPSGSSDVFFLTAREGWALQANSSTPKQAGPATIYHTGDGGAHWTALWHIDSTPTPGGMLFTDATHGFMGSSNYDGIGRLYVTSDGGATWQIALLPQPPDGWYSGCCGKVLISPAVTLFGSNGFLTIDGLPQTVVYTTSDFGRSWSYKTRLPVGAPLARLLDPTNWRATDGQKLFATADAGATWSQIPLRLPTGGSLYLDSLSASDSETLWGVINGSMPGVPNSACWVGFGPQCIFLIRSTDGGVHWTNVQLPANTAP